MPQVTWVGKDWSPSIFRATMFTHSKNYKRLVRNKRNLKRLRDGHIDHLRLMKVVDLVIKDLDLTDVLLMDKAYHDCQFHRCLIETKTFNRSTFSKCLFVGCEDSTGRLVVLSDDGRIELHDV